MAKKEKNSKQFSVTLSVEVQRDIEEIRSARHKLSQSEVLRMLIKLGLYMHKIMTTDNENLKKFLIHMLWLNASEIDEVEKMLIEKTEKE